ncbi:MAG: sulfotransferase family protein [Candidatus Xenobia bacterium]
MGFDAELAEMWKQVLDVAEVRPDDDFRKLGGTARHGKQLAELLAARFREVVHPQIVLNAPTLAVQARYLERFYLQPLPELPDDRPNVANWRQFLGQCYHGQAAVAPGPRNPPAIFILSPIRGGTTLLRVMLAGHPALFSPPELDLLSFTCMAERDRGMQDGWYDYLAIERSLMELQGLDAEAARQQVRQFVADNLPCQEVYRRLQALAAPRTLVDKSTAYGHDPEVLPRAEQWFEAPRYVHLTRHPLATIRSFIHSRMWLGLPDTGNPRHTAEMAWLLSHEHFLAFLAGVPAKRQHRMTFESLAADPEGELQKLARCLGIAFDPAMLRPYEGSRMLDGIDGFSASDPTFHKRQRVEADAARGSCRMPGDGPLAAETIAMAERLGYTDL